MKTLTKGQIFSIVRKFSQEEVLHFSKLSGDNNPLHYDTEFCKTTNFKKPIIHGMLGASLFSNLLGNNITGSIYISQTLKFLKPIYIDEEIEAKVIITDIIKERKQIRLLTEIVKLGEKETATTGEAVIKFPIEKYNIII
jgi:acyl dehydratase